MKKILIITIILLSFKNSFAQWDTEFRKVFEYGRTDFEIICPIVLEPNIDNGQIVYKKILEFDALQKTIHGILLKYIGESYKSAKSVIDVNDMENGLILVKGEFNTTYQRYNYKTKYIIHNMNSSHNLMFEIKDNRLRITFDNIKVKIDNSTPTNFIKFFDTYKPIDGNTNNEEDFRFKANMSLAINAIDPFFRGFIEGIEGYITKELNDDW